MDMYDEFGNYIGPELSDDDSAGAAGEDQDEVRHPPARYLGAPLPRAIPSHRRSRPDHVSSHF
jgi:hypothetical protein